MTTIFSNPLRFDAGGDFAAPATEEEAFLAEVKFVVMTRKRAGKIGGEIPWDQKLGSRVDYLRHDRDTVDPVEIAAELQEAFRAYLEEGRIQAILVTEDKGALTIRIQYGKDKSTTLTIPASSW